MLETERLILRKLTVDDAEALYRIYHEPHVLKYFAQGPPESIDAERAGIQRHLITTSSTASDFGPPCCESPAS